MPPETAPTEAPATETATGGAPESTGATLATGDAPESSAAADAGDKTEGDKAEGTLATEQKKEGDKEEPKGAPEKYEAFTTPKDISLSDELLTTFGETAKRLNLSQKDAQSLLDDLGPAVAKNNAQELANIAKEATAQWAKEAKADKEFGGDAFDKNMAVARQAMQFATPELRKVLDDSGLGNHPEVIRWMFRVGKQLQQDGKHVSGTQETGGPKTPTQILWPKAATN